jgi:predicted nucleic acid-binding protein
VSSRWLLQNSKQAGEALRRGPLAAPSVIVPETANAIVKAVRFAGLDRAEATSALHDFFALPLDLVPDKLLAVEAVAVAVEFELTAYDASYIVLAARRGAPLITADRRLAEAYELGELID